jgi:hypothetical protein
MTLSVNTSLVKEAKSMSSDDGKRTTSPIPVTPQQKAAVRRAVRKRSKKPLYVIVEVPEKNLQMFRELLKLGGVEGKVVFAGRPGEPPQVVAMPASLPGETVVTKEAGR